MTSSKQKSNKTSGRLVLIFLAILFIGPIVAAWSLYSDKEFMPVTLNHGQLINPPLVMQDLLAQNPNGTAANWAPLLGKWQIVYVNQNACDKSCEEHIYFIRQLRTALGKNQDRVDRIYITTKTANANNFPAWMSQNFQGMQLFFANSTDLNQYFSALTQKHLLANVGNIFIVDPLGNVMMVYPATQKPKDIFQDLQRLLMISQVG